MPQLKATNQDLNSGVPLVEFEALCETIDLLRSESSTPNRIAAINFLKQQASAGYADDPAEFIANKKKLELYLKRFLALDDCAKSMASLPVINPAPSVRQGHIETIKQQIDAAYTRLEDVSVSGIPFVVNHFVKMDKSIIPLLGELGRNKNSFNHPVRMAIIDKLRQQAYACYYLKDIDPNKIAFLTNKITQFKHLDELIIQTRTNLFYADPHPLREEAVKRLHQFAESCYGDDRGSYAAISEALSRQVSELHEIDKRVEAFKAQLALPNETNIFDELLTKFRNRLYQSYAGGLPYLLQQENQFKIDIKKINTVIVELPTLIENVNTMQDDNQDKWRYARALELKCVLNIFLEKLAEDQLVVAYARFKSLKEKVTNFTIKDKAIKHAFSLLATHHGAKCPELINHFRAKLSAYYANDELSARAIAEQISQLNQDFYLLKLAVDQILSLKHSYLSEEINKKIKQVIIDMCAIEEIDYVKMRKNIMYLNTNIASTIVLVRAFTIRMNRFSIVFPERTIFYEGIIGYMTDKLAQLAGSIAPLDDPSYDDDVFMQTQALKAAEEYKTLQRVCQLFSELEDQLVVLRNSAASERTDNSFRKHCTFIYKNAKLLLKEDISDKLKSAIRKYIQKTRDIFAKNYNHEHHFEWLDVFAAKATPIEVMDASLKDLIKSKSKLSNRAKLGLFFLGLIVASAVVASLIVLTNGAAVLGLAGLLLSVGKMGAISLIATGLFASITALLCVKSGFSHYFSEKLQLPRFNKKKTEPSTDQEAKLYMQQHPPRPRRPAPQPPIQAEKVPLIPKDDIEEVVMPTHNLSRPKR